MIVADGSAIVTAATDPTERGSRIRARLAREGPVAAPHLVDAEIGQGIRGLALRGVITLTDAERSRASAELLVTARFAHRPYGARAWELRDNVSFYDGLYVARWPSTSTRRCSPPIASSPAQPAHVAQSNSRDPDRSSSHSGRSANEWTRS